MEGIGVIMEGKKGGIEGETMDRASRLGNTEEGCVRTGKLGFFKGKTENWLKEIYR